MSKLNGKVYFGDGQRNRKQKSAGFDSLGKGTIDHQSRRDDDDDDGDAFAL